MWRRSGAFASSACETIIISVVHAMAPQSSRAAHLDLLGRSSSLPDSLAVAPRRAVCPAPCVGPHRSIQLVQQARSFEQRHSPPLQPRPRLRDPRQQPSGSRRQLPSSPQPQPVHHAAGCPASAGGSRGRGQPQRGSTSRCRPPPPATRAAAPTAAAAALLDIIIIISSSSTQQQWAATFAGAVQRGSPAAAAAATGVCRAAISRMRDPFLHCAAPRHECASAGQNCPCSSLSLPAGLQQQQQQQQHGAARSQHQRAQQPGGARGGCAHRVQGCVEVFWQVGAAASSCPAVRVLLASVGQVGAVQTRGASEQHHAQPG